jgi:DNA ligase 1
MATIPKPMLAGRPESEADFKFPTMGSPKLDGIRCLMVKGKPVTRKFLPIPNRYIRAYLEKYAPDGLDGELMMRGKSSGAGIMGPDFSAVQSGIMRKSGEPDFTYNVFDYVGGSVSLDTPFDERLQRLERVLKMTPDPDHRIGMLDQKLLPDLEALRAYEQGCVEDGFEGIVVRDPKGPYKGGRSTVNEGYMLKVKRFTDAEARVLELRPMMHNDNEAQKDAFGRTKRSHMAEGMVQMDTLGKMLVKDLKTGIEFEVGTGFTMEMREKLWRTRAKHVGRIITYKSQEIGTKDAPRFPVFKGFRDTRDIGDVA